MLVDKTKRTVRRLYRRLFEKAAEILFRHDPVGINFEFNTDEYNLEVGTILPKLRHASTEREVLEMIHAEFHGWFGVDTAGSIERYERAAGELWGLWLEYRERFHG